MDGTFRTEIRTSITISEVSMAATVTVTGTVGPGRTLTAGVFTGVTNINLDTVANMLYFDSAQGRKEVSINAATTITATKSGSTYTLTIS